MVAGYERAATAVSSALATSSTARPNRSGFSAESTGVTTVWAAARIPLVGVRAASSCVRRNDEGPGIAGTLSRARGGS